MENESLAIKILAEELFDKRHILFRGCIAVVGISDRWSDVAIGAIAEVLLDLPSRMIIVLYLRLCRGWTLEKIARGLSISRERVRQIENSGLRKLRHPSRRQAIIRNMREVVNSPAKTPALSKPHPHF